GDGRFRTAGLHGFPDPTLQLQNLDRHLTVRRIELRGAPILAERFVELAARLEHARLIEMLMRRVDHRALECDLVLGAVRLLLYRVPVMLDRCIPVTRARRIVAAAVRTARATACHER